MQRRYRWVATALLLPALILRSLIPVGFMPMTDTDGAMEIALCPGTIDVATFIAKAADPHAQHLNHEHRSPPCSYALSGTAMPAPVLPAHLPSIVLELPLHSSATTSVFLPTITRVQWPRGPPTTV